MKFEEAFASFRKGNPIVKVSTGYYIVYCPKTDKYPDRMIMCEKYSGRNGYAVFENCLDEINPPSPHWLDDIVYGDSWHIGRYIDG